MTTTTTTLLKIYAKNLSLITVLAGLAIYTTQSFKPEFIHTLLPYFLIYFFIISFSFHYVLLKASEKDIKKFIPYFMGANGIKLMIYLFTLLIVVLIDRAEAIPFIIGFFALYLIYTIFEVITFLRQSKKY